MHPRKNPPLINRNPQANSAEPDQLSCCGQALTPMRPEGLPGRAEVVSHAQQR